MLIRLRMGPSYLLVNSAIPTSRMNHGDTSLIIAVRSEPLLHPARHSAQVAIHLAGRGAENKRHDGFAGDVYVLEAAKDVDLLVREDDSE